MLCRKDLNTLKPCRIWEFPTHRKEPKREREREIHTHTYIYTQRREMYTWDIWDLEQRGNTVNSSRARVFLQVGHEDLVCIGSDPTSWVLMMIGFFWTGPCNCHWIEIERGADGPSSNPQVLHIWQLQETRMWAQARWCESTIQYLDQYSMNRRRWEERRGTYRGAERERGRV